MLVLVENARQFFAIDAEWDTDMISTLPLVHSFNMKSKVGGKSLATMTFKLPCTALTWHSKAIPSGTTREGNGGGGRGLP